MEISGRVLDSTLSSGKISGLKIYNGNCQLRMVFNTKGPEVSRAN